MNIFNAEIISAFFRDHYFLFLAGIFFGTFICTWYVIPKIIWVSREKQLSKPVIDRSAHEKPIPTFGGVAFFITIVLTLSLVQALRLSHVGNHLIAAITILFMVGLKDDLVVSSAKVKLVGQITAIAFLIFAPDLAITSLHGFLGIHELPEVIGYGLAAFLLLAVINSYNLIDGIDGLAAVTGIIIGGAYSMVFYFAGEHFYVLVSMTLVGILCGYLRFNFSRGKRKIFMGDSGALTIGLIIGFLTLRLLNLDTFVLGHENIIDSNRLLFVFAVLFIPFFDTTRSIVIRMVNNKSPFSADRNHTHHVLLDAGFSHMQVTSLLGMLNCLVLFSFLVFSSYFGSVVMSTIMLGIFVLCCWGFHSMKRKYSGKEKSSNAKNGRTRKLGEEVYPKAKQVGVPVHSMKNPADKRKKFTYENSPEGLN